MNNFVKSLLAGEFTFKLLKSLISKSYREVSDKIFSASSEKLKTNKPLKTGLRLNTKSVSSKRTPTLNPTNARSEPKRSKLLTILLAVSLTSNSNVRKTRKTDMLN